MLRNICKYLCILALVSVESFPENYSPNCGEQGECLDKAYVKSTGENKSTLDTQRISELNFVCSGEPCCLCGKKGYWGG